MASDPEGFAPVGFDDSASADYPDPDLAVEPTSADQVAGSDVQELSGSDLLDRIVELDEEIAAVLADEAFRTPLVRTPLSMIRQGIAALEQGMATEAALERE